MNRLQYHICHGVCMPPFLDLKSKHEAVNRLLSTRYWCFVSGVGRTLVFVEQKRQADFLASYLSQMELPTTSIHGYCLLSVLLLVSLTIFLFFYWFRAIHPMKVAGWLPVMSAVFCS